MASNGLVLHSEFPKETHQFTWRIGDFDQVRESVEMVKASKIMFDMGRGIGLPVTLEAFLFLQPKVGGRHDEHMIGVGFTAVHAPEDAKEVMAMAKFKIGDKVDPLQSGSIQNLLKECKAGGKGYDPKYLSLDPASGSLLIGIEVTLYNTQMQEVITIPVLVSRFQETFLQKLVQDMGKLRKDPGFSAGAPEIVRVISKDGKEFPVNWVILAGRSPVFRTLFQTPMSEVKDGIVKIDDIDGDALEVILEFLHAGTLQENWKEPGTLEEVIYGAHKYGIQDLLEFLKEAMEILVTPENCTDLLRLVHTLELTKAQKTLMDKCWKQAKGPEDFMQLFQNMDFRQ